MDQPNKPGRPDMNPHALFHKFKEFLIGFAAAKRSPLVVEAVALPGLFVFE